MADNHSGTDVAPDPEGAAQAVMVARQSASLDLVVEVVEFRYRQANREFRNWLVGILIAVLALGTAVAAEYVRGVVARVELEVLRGRAEIEAATASGVAALEAARDGTPRVSPSPN